MAEITNSLSWSKSRNENFKFCPRFYFFYYYAYWYGWDINIHDDIFKLYIYRNIKNKHILTGDLFHQFASKLIDDIYSGNLKEAEFYESFYLTKARNMFNFSAQKLYNEKKKEKFQKKSPNHYILYEHEYGEEIDVEEITLKLQKLIEKFYNSPLLTRLKNKKFPVLVKEPGPRDPLSHFKMDGANVYAIIDLALDIEKSNREKGEGKRVIIFDWKTGRKPEKTSEKDDIQLITYSNLILEKFKENKYSLSDMVAAEYYPLQEEEKDRYRYVDLNGERLKETLEYIKAQIKIMSGYHTEFEKVYGDIEKINETAADLQPRVRTLCRKCQYRKICAEIDN